MTWRMCLSKLKACGRTPRRGAAQGQVPIKSGIRSPSEAVIPSQKERLWRKGVCGKGQGQNHTMVNIDPGLDRIQNLLEDTSLAGIPG